MGFALFFFNIYRTENSYNFGFLCFKKGESWRSMFGLCWDKHRLSCDLLWINFGLYEGDLK